MVCEVLKECILLGPTMQESRGLCKPGDIVDVLDGDYVLSVIADGFVQPYNGKSKKRVQPDFVGAPGQTADNTSTPSAPADNTSAPSK